MKKLLALLLLVGALFTGNGLQASASNEEDPFLAISPAYPAIPSN